MQQKKRRMEELEEEHFDLGPVLAQRRKDLQNLKGPTAASWEKDALEKEIHGIEQNRSELKRQQDKLQEELFRLEHPEQWEKKTKS